MGTRTLLEASAETQALTGASRSALVAEAHERIGNSLNGLVAPLIGFATLLLGGFSRFGIWRQIIGAIFALILVQMLTQIGQDTVQGNADLWFAAYVGPVFGTLLALGLLYLAANPAVMRLKRGASA